MQTVRKEDEMIQCLLLAEVSYLVGFGSLRGIYAKLIDFVFVWCVLDDAVGANQKKRH